MCILRGPGTDEGVVASLVLASPVIKSGHDGAFMWCVS